MQGHQVDQFAVLLAILNTRAFGTPIAWEVGSLNAIQMIPDMFFLDYKSGFTVNILVAMLCFTNHVVVINAVFWIEGTSRTPFNGR